MKKIKEFNNVYLEYPDIYSLKEDEINLLKQEREELLKTKIVVSREEIIRRMEELDRGRAR
jgi:hypothetical protein